MTLQPLPPGNGREPYRGNAIVIMAKRPYPGRTKTRLQSRLSAHQAAGLYESFLLDVLHVARAVPDSTLFIAYHPLSETRYFQQLAPGTHLMRQQGNDLGERLHHALSRCLAQGYARVLAVNSDSPTLPASYLAQAFQVLSDIESDVVLGPCADGGYYLIGWKHPHPRLVREVQMSTPYVLLDTLALAAAEGLRVALLPEAYDIDTGEDLQRLLAEMQTRPEAAPFTRAYCSRIGLLGPQPETPK